MKKIGIPICGDSFEKYLMACMPVLMMFLLAVVQFMVFQDGGFFELVIGFMLFGWQFAMFMMLCMVFDKEDWIENLIPFKFIGRCSR